MAQSLFGRINSLFSAPAGAAVVSPPAAPAPRQLVRSMPKPPAGDQVDRPDVALRQIVKLQLLDAIMPPRPVAVMRAQIFEHLHALKQIPALESLARGFSRVVSRPDVSIEEVVEVVAKDPALSVRILRMANSVDTGSEQRVDRLDVAVQLLGLERVRKASDAMFFLGAGSKVCSSLNWQHLWVHSLGTAAIAEWLEKNLRNGDGSSLYVAGLLHDVGKIVLSTLAPDEYKSILLESFKEQLALDALEHLRLGVDHCEAGLAFAEQNQMAPLINDVIQFHGAPARAGDHRYEIAVVALANHLAKAYGFGFSGSGVDLSEVAVEDLPAWTIIVEETGTGLEFLDLEEDFVAFTRRLRSDLNALRGD